MDRKIFKCPHCSKGFHCSSHLTTHVRTHTGEKPYQCGQCPKSFALLGNLTAHVRTHTGEKPYTCKYCTKSFTQSTNLNVHMRVHTGERPYKCQRCQKAFKTGGALNGHVKSCWKFLDIVSKHLPGFRRSGNVAASRAGIHVVPGGRGRGIKKTPVMIGTERNRFGLPVSGTSLSKSSLHNPSEINCSPMLMSGSSNVQNYRKKLSIYFAKKRMNLASLTHSKSVNKPLGTNSSLAITSHVQSSNTNTVSSSTKSLDTTIKQEQVLNTLNSCTKTSGNERENQMTNSGPSNPKIVDNLLTWKKEVLPHKIINSNNDSNSSNSFDSPSNIYNKIGSASASNLSDIPLGSIESKNFNISDFSQPLQVRSDKESLTIDFNPVSSINKSPLVVQSGQAPCLTQSSRPAPAIAVFDLTGNNKQTVSEIPSRNIHTLSSSQTGLSFSSRANREKPFYKPNVPTNNNNNNNNNNNFALTTHPLTFVPNTVSFKSPIIHSSTETCNEVKEKKFERNYFSDQHLFDNSTISNIDLPSTPDNSTNNPKYSQNTDYQNPSSSLVSRDSHYNFVETTILERVFRCRLCGLIFDKMESFQSHMPLHEEDELLVCKFCELDFRTPLELVLHMRTHSLPRQMCELCGQMVVSTRFAAHLLTHAANMKKVQNQTRTFWCRFCDKSFNQQAYLDLHLRIHASQSPAHFNATESKTALSPLLQTTDTTTAGSSVTHTVIVSDSQTTNPSSTQTKIFSCLYCKKEFPNLKNLIIHMRSHAVSNPYKCKKCHQVFRNMIAYNTHKKSCFQDQKYELRECFSSSSSSSSTSSTSAICTPAITTTITSVSGSATRAITATVTAVSTLCTERVMNKPDATPRPNSLTNLNNETTKEPVIRPSSAPQSSSLFNESNNFSHLHENSIGNSLKSPLNVENSSQNAVFRQSQTDACSEGEELDQEEAAAKRYRKSPVSDSISNVAQLVISSVTGGNDNEEKMECGKSSSENVLPNLDERLAAEKKKCFLCFEEFHSKTLLSEHLQTAHDSHELAACRICNKTFTGIDECIEHSNCKPLTLSLKMRCEFCDVTFDSDSDYKRHKEQHRDTDCSGAALYKNNDSNERSVPLGNAVQKDPSLEIISCKICNKQFTKLNSLSMHMRTFHAPRHTNLNKCRQCERSFTSHSHLYVHQMKAHDRSQPLRCKYCKKPFKHWTHLKTHLRTHTGERPYECHICPKSFSQLGNLIAHMRTHTGEKPYKCHHCDKSFTQSTNLNVHMRVHTNERPYQCLLCMTAFKTSGACNSHLRSCSGFKGKNKNVPLSRNRTRERQLKRKLTFRKRTPNETNLSNPSLISESPLGQDFPPLSNSNQLTDSDTESLTVDNKLTNALEKENPVLSNTSPLRSTLQQMEKDDSKTLPDLKMTEVDDDFQVENENKVSDCCSNKEQIPTIQGIYRNQFCNDIPSNSKAAVLDNIAPVSEKEATRQIFMTLCSNLNEKTRNLPESQKPISSDNNDNNNNNNNPPQVSYNLNSDDDKNSNNVEDSNKNNNNANHDDDDDDPDDTNDVIIDNADSNLGVTTQAINLDDKNLVEEFTNLDNSNSSNLYPKETVDIVTDVDATSFEEQPTKRYLFQGTESEVRNSNIFNSSTSLLGSRTSSLPADDYTPSQTCPPFSVSYDTDGPSRSYATTVNVNEIGSQSTNNLYSNQPILDQNLVQPCSFLYNCSKCSDVFTSASDLTEHMMISHRPSSDVLPSTSYIDLDLSPSQDFDSVTTPLDPARSNQQHLFKVQTTTMDQLQLLSGPSDNNEEDSQTPLIQCKLCPKRFTKPYSLAVHMKTHAQQQASELQVHTCKICPNPEIFLNAEALTDHLKKKHGDFPCSFCNKVWQSLSQLETHMRTHTGERPYCCPHCPKTFAVNCNLVAHVRIHTGERPFRCQYCNKSFTQAANLNVHTRIHTGERPYNCSMCKKAFRTSSALKGHVKCCIYQTGNLPKLGSFSDS